MTRESHLAANPGAVVGEDAYTEYAKVRILPYFHVFVFVVEDVLTTPCKYALVRTSYLILTYLNRGETRRTVREFSLLRRLPMRNIPSILLVRLSRRSMRKRRRRRKGGGV